MSIKHVYSEFDHETKRWRWGLGPEDFEKVRQGYGCPECLEDFNGVLLLQCPACGHARNQALDFLPTPDHFLPGVAAPAPKAGL